MTKTRGLLLVLVALLAVFTLGCTKENTPAPSTAGENEIFRLPETQTAAMPKGMVYAYQDGEKSFVVGVPGSNMKTFDCTDPVLAPSGDRLLCVQNGMVKTYSLVGQGDQKDTAEIGPGFLGTFSPDGSRIAVAAVASNQMVTITIYSNSEVRTLAQVFALTSMSWPEPNQLYFTGLHGGWVSSNGEKRAGYVDTTTGTVTQITAEPPSSIDYETVTWMNNQPVYAIDDGAAYMTSVTMGGKVIAGDLDNFSYGASMPACSQGYCMIVLVYDDCNELGFWDGKTVTQLSENMQSLTLRSPEHRYLEVRFPQGSSLAR